MTDWRSDLMDALIDMRREAKWDDYGEEMPAIEERIDRAVEAARAEAWDNGYDSCANARSERNPHYPKEAN